MSEKMTTQPTDPLAEAANRLTARISMRLGGEKAAQMILDELRKVQEEAYRQGFEELQAHRAESTAQSRAAGRKQGLEEAAKLVAGMPGNTYTSDCDHQELAAEIQSLIDASGKDREGR